MIPRAAQWDKLSLQSYWLTLITLELCLVLLSIPGTLCTMRKSDGHQNSPVGFGRVGPDWVLQQT